MQSSSSSSLAVSTTRRFSRGKSSPPLPSALRSSEATSPQSPTVRGRSRSSLSKEHSSEEEQQRDRGSTRERATTGAQPEEYVTFTSSDETALVHEGWLWKTDPYGKHWKKRYVVADASTGTLRYYGSHPTVTFAKYSTIETPKGIIPLEGAKVEEADPSLLKRNKDCNSGFILQTNDRTTVFGVENSGELQPWLQAISRVVKAYQSVKTTSSAGRGYKLLYLEPVMPARLMGVLRKTSPDQQTWTERLCVLDPEITALIYYRSLEPSESECRGIIDIRDASLLSGVSEERGALSELPGFRLRVKSSEGSVRIYGFCAPNKDAAQLWINYIAALMSVVNRGPSQPSGRASMREPPEGLTASGSVRIEKMSTSRRTHGREIVSKNGWLKKCNTNLSLWSWRSRYFTLDGPEKILSYSSSDSDKGKEKGSISLKDARIRMGSPLTKTPNPFVFSIETPERIYYLCAEGLEEMKEWCRLLEMCSRDDCEEKSSPMIQPTGYHESGIRTDGQDSIRRSHSSC